MASDSGASNSGADSDLIRRATSAGKHSVALCKTIEKYESPRPRVRALIKETSALAGELESLIDAYRANTELQNPALAIPLERCAWTCQQLKQEIERSSTSDDRGTKSCPWGKLRYMGKDIDNFTQLLSGYRETISFALTMASVPESHLTVGDIKKYTMLLSTAERELESRLDALDDMPDQNLTGFDSESDAVVQINKEKQSAEQCLRICAQFSDYIAVAQLTNANKSPRSNKEGNIELDSESEENASDDIRERKKRHSCMKAELDSIEQRQLGHLLEKATTVSNSSPAEMAKITADMATMTEGWKLFRKLADELSSTITKLEIEMTSSVFENHGTGSMTQFFVSTKGKTLRGKNEGAGWKVQQFVGYAEDDTVKQVSKDMSKTSVPNAKTSEELSGIADAVMAKVVHGESAHLPQSLAIDLTRLNPATSHGLLARAMGN